MGIDINQRHQIGRHEALRLAMTQKRQQAVVEAVMVEQADGLGVIAELAPRPGFKKFLESANAARQGQKSAGAGGHEVLALVHGLHNVQLGAAAMGMLALNQRLRNNANDAAARLQRGISHSAHEAVFAAAIHKLAAVLADPAARLRGQGGKSRISASAGAAINANGKGGFFHERTGVEENQNEKEGADSARRSKNRRQASLHAPSRATFSRKTGADGGQPNAASQQQRQQHGGAAKVFGPFGKRVPLQSDAVNGRLDAAVE